jgi:hypothetical protein
MKRLLGLILALALCDPAFADVAVGNGSVGVPVAATQGGTGQSSFTTNCAVVASSSSALTCTLSPTLTGTNFTGIPDAGLTSGVPDRTTCTTWVPTDQSGASLVLTFNSTSLVCHTVHTDGTFSTYISVDITYPTTASGSNAAISLPYNSYSGGQQALTVGEFDSATVIGASVGTINSSTFAFHPNGTQGVQTNVLMSTHRVVVSGTYRSAS